MQERTARLFVAVWLPAALRDELALLARPAQRGLRWVPPEHWHVTLRFLGQADPDAVRARLDGTAFSAATATLGPTVQRLGRGTVVVPVGGLDELAAAVVAVTGDIGQPVGERAFRGHVTLARLRGSARCPLVGAPVHAEAAVGEVVLVRSRLRPTGAEYEPIMRWPAR